MKNKWEEFANSNAEYYILTHEKVDFMSEEGQQYFFTSGIEDTRNLLKNVGHLINQKSRALEIGCGIGRLAFAHAEIFQEVVGVDVSETMLKKLNALAAKNQIAHVKTFIADGPWDQEKHYDYIYSYIVFQHIADFLIIEDYIRRISRAIADNGIIQLHFDTRKPSFLYRLRYYLPDMFLPRSQRKGIRRNRREASKLVQVFQKYNLRLIQELNPNTADHFFILAPNIPS